MDVDEILSAHHEKYKSTDVHKEVQLTFDLGNLLASDLNHIDTTRLRQESDDYLKELGRDNTQLLINEIWKLPITRVEESVVVELPPPTTILPREKPIPKQKAPTKWEQFAKTKGITKRKRSHMVFDEKTQEWKPRWGYKRINDSKDDWLIEVPVNADPYEDQFEKRSEARKERIAKNEYQRLRNIAKTEKSGRIKVPLPPADTKKMNKHQLTQALGTARKSTASVGVFTDKLAAEPTPKQSGKKTKFDPLVGVHSEEKERSINVLKKVTRKKEILDTKKATNKLISEEQRRAHKRKITGDGGKGAKKSKKGVSHKALPKSKGLMKQRAKNKRKRK